MINQEDKTALEEHGEPVVSKFDPTASNPNDEDPQEAPRDSSFKGKLQAMPSPSASGFFRSITNYVWNKSSKAAETKELKPSAIHRSQTAKYNTVSTTGVVKRPTAAQQKAALQPPNTDSASATSSLGSFIQSEQKAPDTQKEKYLKVTLNTQQIKHVKWQAYNAVRIKDKVQIELVKADLTAEKSEAIVSPANIFLEHITGIAGQVVLKGGTIIQDECTKYQKRYGPVSTGSCMYTTAGDLPSKYVIHTPGPIWSNYKVEKKAMDLLQRCVTTCLDRAKKLKDVRTISIPAISAGSGGGNPTIVATIILQACLNWSMQKETGALRTIRICNVEDPINLVFLEKLHLIFRSAAGFDRYHQEYQQWLAESDAAGLLELSDLGSPPRIRELEESKQEE